jgi:hypothetical protein
MVSSAPRSKLGREPSIIHNLTLHDSKTNSF